MEYRLLLFFSTSKGSESYTTQIEVCNKGKAYTALSLSGSLADALEERAS